MRRKFRINKFKVKTISKYLFVLIVIVGGLMLFPSTLSMYSSKGESSVTIDVAYSLLSTDSLSDTIVLEDILPNGEYKEYTFAIRNYDDEGNRIDVNIKYSVNIRTTTNLPIKYEVYDNNGSLISENYSTETDEYGTIFNVIKSEEYLATFDKNIENTFTIKYKLDDIYNDSKYQDIADLIVIDINAEQVV